MIFLEKIKKVLQFCDTFLINADSVKLDDNYK